MELNVIGTFRMIYNLRLIEKSEVLDSLDTQALG